MGAVIDRGTLGIYDPCLVHSGLAGQCGEFNFWVHCQPGRNPGRRVAGDASTFMGQVLPGTTANRSTPELVDQSSTAYRPHVLDPDGGWIGLCVGNGPSEDAAALLVASKGRQLPTDQQSKHTLTLPLIPFDDGRVRRFRKPSV